MNWCWKEGGYEEETKIVFVYGAEVFLNNFLKIVFCLTLGWLFGKGMESVIFFGVFGFVRTRLGGWHAGTELGCFMITGILWAVNVFLTKDYIGVIAGAAVSGTLLAVIGKRGRDEDGN